jgi:hypothetical protein
MFLTQVRWVDRRADDETIRFTIKKCSYNTVANQLQGAAMNHSYILLVALLIPILHRLDSSAIPGYARGVMLTERTAAPDVEMNPDSLWLLGIPYFSFVQLYDSCRVRCTFGEVVHETTDGIQHGIDLFSHNVGNNPRCFESLSNMNDSSRTYYLELDPGSSINYYKEIVIELRSAEVLNYSVLDTLLFYTVLIDSSTGDVIAFLDTLGVLPFYHADSSWNKMSLPGSRVSSNNYTLFSYTYHGMEMVKAYLAVLVVFKGAVANEFLCREDFIAPGYRSILAEMRQQIYEQVLDSIFVIGKRSSIPQRRQNSLVRGYRVHAYPNPTVNNVSLVFQSVLAGMVDMRLYDTAGKLLWSSGPVSVMGGAEKQFLVSVEKLSSGTYYAIPIFNGNILGGTSFVISN